MTVASARLVAAMLLLVLTGSPVATVICVQQCSAAAQSSAVTQSEHCHEPGPADSAVIKAPASDECNLLTVRDVATRERVLAPLGAAPLVTAQPHVAMHVGLSREMFATSPYMTPWIRIPLAAGATLPLRI